jgi:hypothetical protein
MKNLLLPLDRANSWLKEFEQKAYRKPALLVAIFAAVLILAFFWAFTTIQDRAHGNRPAPKVTQTHPDPREV